METKAVYIHIPFCKKICNYCDFCKVYYQEKFVIPYLKMLDLEIKNRYQGEFVDTIYIGGGTPSCLSLLELKQLFTSIKRIHTSKDLEFTFECNASDITEELLSFLKENGVNRFSIGIESFQKEVLNFLGRTISKEEMIAKIELAKSYFSNINLDFIYAVPTQTIEMLKEDLAIFLSLDVTHISTYSLMIEEHTKLGIENTIPISDELDYQMYKMICSILEKNGFSHYEISNFCKSGYESKHNFTYWQNLPYYGFGVGASGFLDSIRYMNTKSITQYLKGITIFEQETMTERIDASNQAILGLRTKKGISKFDFYKKFQKDFISYFEVEDLLQQKILIEEDGYYRMNSKYWYLSNEILERFV